MKKILTTLIATLLYSTMAQAAVPLSFTHHGVLKEDDALVNGQRNISVSIIDQDGNVAGSFSDNIDVKAGLYNVTIDNINAAMVSAAQKLLLKIEVEGQELTPPLPINAVPYALSAYSADSVACTKCIKPEQLTFNALQDSALPNCGVNQVLRQADGAIWECSDQVNIDSSSNSLILKGNIGINISKDFDAGYFKYTYLKEITSSELQDDMVGCECDKTATAYDCPEEFKVTKDNNEFCYDVFGGSYKIYQRDAIFSPVEGAVAISDGQIGVGTGRPNAPLHIRTLNGANKYEAILADTQPEILLEDLDGANVKIALNDGVLAVSSISNNLEKNLLTIGDQGLNITESIAQGAISVDKINKQQLVDLIYPVGFIMTTTSDTNPGSYLGGTWESFGAGRVLLGAGAGYTAGTTAGSSTISYKPNGTVGNTTLTTNQIPSHTHTFKGTTGTTGSSTHYHTFTDYYYPENTDKSGISGVLALGYNTFGSSSSDSDNNKLLYYRHTTDTDGSHTHSFTPSGTNTATGGGGAHNHSFSGTTETLDNMQPYYVVYMWRRIN